MKRALIFGVTGQDGSYLADILLARGYEVHGMYRRSATGNTRNIRHLLNRISLHQGDLADPISISRIIHQVKPQEIYNEADQDNVDWSYATVAYSSDITASAVARILEIIYQTDRSIKFFQPVSATMFGNHPAPQDESTPFDPQSPYACAKTAAYYLTRYYRNVLGLFASTAIFYNHDSPRRTEEYLLQRISRAAVSIARGKQESVSLGYPGLHVDIGYAEEYMHATWQIMQLDRPDDFVVSTGKTYSIREITKEAFRQAGIPDESDELIIPNPNFHRPGKQTVLVGNNQKAKEAFGFVPQWNACSLVRLLVDFHGARTV